jgi:RNA polymerase sigma-70 factor (ECF subfamily)
MSSRLGSASPRDGNRDRRSEGPKRARRRRFFQAEIERLMDRLYGTALRLTRQRADAEDLVAEALTKAWAQLGSLEDLQSFEKWIFRILTNTFISDRRRPRETLATELEGEEGDALSLFDKLHQPFLLWWGNPEQRLLDQLLREDIERALDSLPEPFRLAVILVDVEGFTYGEAAEALSIPVGTVRSRLSRARRLLQGTLWKEAQQLGLAAER